MSELKTAEEARDEIRRSGLTISKWAMQNGLTPSAVYAVLKGGLQGNYGDAHKAAVLLGMKEGEIAQNEISEQRKHA